MDDTRNRQIKINLVNSSFIFFIKHNVYIVLGLNNSCITEKDIACIVLDDDHFI